jgi:hypothetical protein
MGRSIGFVGLLIVLAIGGYLYTHQGGGADTSTATAVHSVDVAGVKSDLLVLANAERSQFALDGKYLPLDELVSRGVVTMSRTGRPPYTYSAEIGGAGFRIVATYNGTPTAGSPRRISIDETMQVSSE